jgi:hypothetical protein
MSFVFASSHLPESKRPQDEEEEEDVLPVLRSGGVRASSHLPQPVSRDPAAPGAPSPAGRSSWATEPQVDAAPEPDDETGSPFSSGHGTAEDTSPWYLPKLTHEYLRAQGEGSGEPEPEPGFGKPAPDGRGASHGSFGPAPSLQGSHDSAAAPDRATPPRGLWFQGRPSPGSAAPAMPSLANRPEISDLLYRRPPQDADAPDRGRPGRLADRPEAHDLLYRFKGSPAEAKARDRSLFRNVADTQGAKPQLTAGAAPAPSAANATPKPSKQDPVAKLKEHVAKSRNPIFIKDYYDEKTPLEEKLLLKQLLLSLKAPEGEKLPLPILNLQHWLNVENRPAAENEGPMEIPFSDLSKFGVMKDGGEKLLGYFSTLPDKKALEQKNMFEWLRSHPDAAGTGVPVPDTHWDALVSGRAPGVAGYFGYARPGNEEFFYGLGDATLTGNASGIKGFVDKNNAASAQGDITYTLKDRYDWNKNQGVTIPLTMEMIQKYLPKGVPLITPKGKSIQINDSFFHELEKLGHGRSFDVQSKSAPYRYEFHQPKPGQPPTHQWIPAPESTSLQFEGPGVLP